MDNIEMKLKFLPLLLLLPALMVVLVGCGGGSQPLPAATPTSTQVLPTATPIPTPSQVPSAVAPTPPATPNPMPIAMATPTPTPTATSAPIPLTDIELPTENEKAALIDKIMTVFGIKVFALEGVTSRDLKLAANVLAQWIDNDEDGTPDNPAVLAEIVRQNSRMILGVTSDQIGTWHDNSQRMLKDEHAPTYGLDVTSINHNWYGLPLSKYSQDHYRRDGLLPPDAATEETFHLITDIGYANIYPSAF